MGSRAARAAVAAVTAAAVVVASAAVAGARWSTRADRTAGDAAAGAEPASSPALVPSHHGQGPVPPATPGHPAPTDNPPIHATPAGAKHYRAPVIAIIDTGVRASHQELVGQLVAWWDFSSEQKGEIIEPQPGQWWDDKVGPYDSNGHGTGVASMAVGKNRSPEKDPSFAPGFPFAMAKVGHTDENGTSVEGDLAAAVRWAVDTVGADVINVSIGSLVPLPDAVSDTHEAFRHARRHGALVVVANGNGWANLGVPGAPGWASLNGNSTEALSVGAEGIDGPITHTDPEVVAKFYNVGVASNRGDHEYRRASGTSFSSPRVAGLALAAIDAARRAGHNPGPAAVETLLKHGARDTNIPPQFEGYGVLDEAQVGPVLEHARANTLPSRPAPDLSATYVEQGGGTAREVWSNKLDSGLEGVRFTNVAGTGPGIIGPSAPTGLSEAERWTVVVPAGQTATLTMDYGDAAWANDDVDVFVFKGTGEAFDGTHLVARSTNPERVAEALSWRGYGDGVFTVVLIGWSVVAGAPISLGTSHHLEFAGDGLAAHTFGTGVLPVHETLFG